MLRHALLAAALVAAPAIAQKTQPRVAPGAKTAAQVSPRVKAEFAASDTNRDGFLSRAEVEARTRRMDLGAAHMSAGQVQMLTDTFFARADANKDGKISAPEMQRLLTAIAGKYDTNHDGVVSAAERQAARQETMSEVQAAGAKKPVQKER